MAALGGVDRTPGHRLVDEPGAKPPVVRRVFRGGRWSDVPVVTAVGGVPQMVTRPLVVAPVADDVVMSPSVVAALAAEAADETLTVFGDGTGDALAPVDADAYPSDAVDIPASDASVEAEQPVEAAPKPAKKRATKKA